MLMHFRNNELSAKVHVSVNLSPGQPKINGINRRKKKPVKIACLIKKLHLRFLTNKCICSFVNYEHINLGITSHQHYLWKNTVTQKQDKKSKFADTVFQNNYLALSWPNFSQFGLRGADLYMQFKMYAQLGPIFILRKQ